MTQDLIIRLEWLAYQLDAPNSCGGGLVREAISLIKQQNWSSVTCIDHDTAYLVPECPKCREEHEARLESLEGFDVFDPEA